MIVVGLAVFTVFGDPAGGKDNAPFSQWVIPLAVFSRIAVAAISSASRGPSPREAALYGICAGVLFGLSAALAKPTVETLHDGLDAVLTSWEAYLMAATGVVAFVVQQVSLSSGRLAASVSTVSVSNPIVAIAIGAIVLDETLAGPHGTWSSAYRGSGGARRSGCDLARRPSESSDQVARSAAEPAST